MTKDDLKDMRRIELREEPFSITGLPWVYERGRYDRIPSEFLPPSVSDIVRNEVSKETSGGIARIRTNSDRVFFRAEVAKVKTILYHMSRMSRSGFDFHVKYPGEERRFIQPAAPIEYGHCSFSCEVKTRLGGLYDETPVKESRKGQTYELTIVFPTYNQVEEACIWVDKDAEVLPPEKLDYDKPVVFYGSSITQGACASRPSLCYTNRIALELNCPIVNFALNGNARGELEMAELIASRDAAAFVMDYDHNAPNAEHLRSTHEKFFRRYRELRPDVPVIFMTKPDYRMTLDDNDERRAIIRETYENALNAGDRHVYFIDGSRFGEGIRDNFLVDGCHPNDIGFDRMTAALKPLIKRILDGQE